MAKVKINSELREHQKIARFNTLKRFKEAGFHALFVDMGLGKTLVSLQLAADLQVPLVISCPKGLIHTWINETVKHTENYNILIWKPTKAKTKKYISEFREFMRRENRLFIVNTEAFQSKPLNKTLVQMLKYITEKPSLMAVDESSFIKTADSNRTKAIVNAGKLFSYRTILTGTEITKSVLDLYAQFLFLDSNYWLKYGIKNFWQFKLRYAVMEDEYATGGRIFKKVVGYQRITELMARIEKDYTRLKAEDWLDLPPKKIERVKLSMRHEQREIYEKLKADLFAEYQGKELTTLNKAALFIRFRQISGGFFPYEEGGEAKATPLRDNEKVCFLLDDIAENLICGEKVIIWASFIPEIELIEQLLKREYKEKSVLTFYGGTSKGAEAVAEKEFNDNPEVRFLVGNPAKGGYGLNLQKNCNLAYYYSLPLSAEHYWQSLARIWRDGQTKECVYKILEYKNSVDQRMFELLQTKTGIREGFRNLSISDFFNIF